MNNFDKTYQEVVIRNVKDDEGQNIRYMSCNASPGAKYMDHLNEAVRLPLKSDTNRVIIIADSKAYGYQAANYLLSKSQSLLLTSHNNTEYDYDEDDFDDLFDEIIEEDDYGNSNLTVPSFDLSKDMIVAGAEIWNPKTDELMPNIMPLYRQSGLINIIDKASNLLLYCSRADQDNDRVMEEIENHLEHLNNFYLLLPSDSVSENFVERLVFEHDFSVIHVKEPGQSQLKDVFKDLAKRYGLRIEKNADIKSIIQELKNYRKILFWEKDIEKLIIKTVKKVQGKVAGKRDFSLYYYKGQDLSGEMLLNKMIGQKEVKDQILRTVANVKLAAYLAEKHGTKTAIYKHMAFAGAPGTGKTQTARITARLFHENGLSNGIFIEAGRNDLVAGYLGQTAIKIAKLFEKAKGGTIFIDEAGSLVQNSQDIYTKEAITTLIRYMENNPDTTVILATYPDEMERLLDSDRGFRSRIAKIIEFESYTDNELWEILKLMASDRHCTIDENAKETVFKYIDSLRKSKKDEFGNAREMRKLLQTAQEEMAFRLFYDKSKSKDELITCDDLKKAVSNLSKMIPKSPNPLGFSMAASFPKSTAV